MRAFLSVGLRDVSRIESFRAQGLGDLGCKDLKPIQTLITLGFRDLNLRTRKPEAGTSGTADGQFKGRV